MLCRVRQGFRRGQSSLEDREPGRSGVRAGVAPLGLAGGLRKATHGLRRGLHSFAASRLIRPSQKLDAVFAGRKGIQNVASTSTGEPFFVAGWNCHLTMASLAN